LLTRPAPVSDNVPGRRLSVFVILVFAAVLPGCIPYAVGTTAQPVAPGETTPTSIFWAVPRGAEVLRDPDGEQSDLPIYGIDGEVRVGIDERSDWGVRIPSGTGIVFNYKRRLTPGEDRSGAAVAVMGGTGFVNAFNHAWFELTLLASGRQARFTPYGGLRVSQVAPIARGAVHDSPTAGGFMGLRIGREDLGVSPEVGFYHDRSALELRSSDYIVVLSIALHGRELLDALGTALSPGGR